MNDEPELKPPLSEALAKVGWLIPKWGPDVLVDNFTAEQPDAEGWHRITVYVKRRPE